MSEMTEAPISNRPERDSFIDFIRAIALVRVVIWHALALPFISYLIAAMPAMFFAAGSLMAKSLSSAQPYSVIRRRLRRLLIPFWAFGAIALTLMFTFAHFTDSRVMGMRPYQLIFWIFPIWDPAGPDWGSGWWVTLWYLRAFVWLLLLSPLLLRLHRRSAAAGLGLPLALLILLLGLGRIGLDAPWQFKDLALYLVFWMLGYSYFDGKLTRMPARGLWLLAAGATSASALLAIYRPPPGGIVNASYVLHLFVGLAWLFGALAARDALVRVASREKISAGIDWINRRPLTVYLWHALGWVCMYQLLVVTGVSPIVRYALALPVVVAVTFVCVLAFGWIEDFAAGKRAGARLRRIAHPSLRMSAAEISGAWRRPVTIGVAMVGAVTVLATVATGIFVRDEVDGAAISAAPPSGAAIIANSQRSFETPEIVDSFYTENEVSAELLDGITSEWFERHEMTSVIVAVRREGESPWIRAFGTDPQTGEPAQPSKHFPITSMTKTFTGALILQLAEQGALGLDDTLDGFVPGFPNSEHITIRQLLLHMSGVPDDSEEPLPADQALVAAAEKPLLFPPGTGFSYSGPDMLLLGLVIESVTGSSYVDSLRARVLEPLGLSRTLMDDEAGEEFRHPYSTHPDRFGSEEFVYYGSRWATGGLWSDIDDLSKFALELFGGGMIIGSEMRSQMVAFHPEHLTGLGIHATCPCRVEEDRAIADRWGKYGGWGMFEYEPHDRVAIAIYSDRPIDEHGTITAVYDDLSNRLRTAILGRPLPEIVSQ